MVRRVRHDHYHHKGGGKAHYWIAGVILFLVFAYIVGGC